MTLQKFSDKSFLSMFKTRLKSALLFPIIGLLILGMYAVVGPFSEVVHLNNIDSYGYRGWDNISIENVKYILFDGLSTTDHDFPDRAVFMYMAVIIAAILCAVMVFRDLSNKKTANVYYSLGFSRSSLFASTYLAGAVSVLGMIVIPFALSFVINLFAFGFSTELLTACIFTISCLANVSLLAYTISAIAITLSGMLFEGIFYSFFLNSVSPIFTFASCMFSDGLLTGGGFVDADANYYYGSFENSFTSAFLGKLSFMNGLSHSAYEVDRLGCCLYTSDIEGLGGFLSEETWRTPAFIPLLVWSVILAGIITLSFYIFNRKKTENIGFFASSPVLYRIFFGTLIVGFSSLGCSSGRTITKGLTWLYILIALAVCLVITTILVLILTKLSRMKFKKEFKVFGIYSLAVILFAAVFSTGFFGYQNRIPAVENVAKVEITAYHSGFEDYFTSQIVDVNNSSSSITMGNFSSYETYTFNKKADITDIEEIHKGLIAADSIKMSKNYKETKLGVKINIIYNLKNGKTLSRSYYRVTPQLIDRYLANKSIGEKVKLSLVQNLHDSITYMGDTEFIDGKEMKAFFTVFSNDLTKATNVEISSVQVMSLLEAYMLDIENLSVKEILNPDCKSLGGIAIRKDHAIYGEWNEELEDNELLGFASEIAYQSLLNYDLNYYTENVFVTINENMTNTIKWAKDVGIYKHFKKDYKTDFMTLEAVHNNSSFIKLAISDNRNYNLLFEGRCILDGVRDDDAYYYDTEGYHHQPLAGSHYVNGLTEDELNFIRDNAHPFYLTTETGYFIRLSTDEAKSLHSTLFIPDSKLTPELKTKLAKNAGKQTEEATQVRAESPTVTISEYSDEPTTYIEMN